MKLKQTIKRLKQLKAMVQMIPKENIDLSMYITAFHPESQENCIMCIGSWVTQFPFLDTEGKLWIQYEEGKPNTADLHSEGNTLEAFKELFGISEEWVGKIFFNHDYEDDAFTHKAHILEVIDSAIEDYKEARARKDNWPF